jgi:hypothetical protein
MTACAHAPCQDNDINETYSIHTCSFSVFSVSGGLRLALIADDCCRGRALSPKIATSESSCPFERSRSQGMPSDWLISDNSDAGAMIELLLSFLSVSLQAQTDITKSKKKQLCRNYTSKQLQIKLLDFISELVTISMKMYCVEKRVVDRFSARTA